MKERDDLLIWQFVDGTISDDDRIFVSQKIQDDQEWSKHHQGVLEVHQQLEQLTWQKPSPDFTEKVIEKVKVAKIYTEPIDAKSIWGKTYLVAQILALILILFRMRSSFLTPNDQNLGEDIYRETILIMQQPMLQMIFVLSFAVLLLLAFDKVLQKYYRGNSVIPT